MFNFIFVFCFYTSSLMDVFSILDLRPVLQAHWGLWMLLASFVGRSREKWRGKTFDITGGG